MAMTIASCHAETLGNKHPSDMYSDPKVVSLVEAAIHGDMQKVKTLKKQGVNVNAVAVDGPTPLMWAIHTNSVNGIKALLDAGADPNLRMQPLRGFSVMELAVGNHDSDSAHILRELLQHGGNPNLQVSDPIHDVSLLAIAAAEGQIENVGLLIAAGADVNAHTEEVRKGAGQSAMSSAIVMGQYPIALYLLQHGYTYRLDHAAGLTRSSLVGPDRKKDRDSVISWFSNHGVEDVSYFQK
jgi:ankyrin repeat protein